LYCKSVAGINMESFTWSVPSKQKCTPVWPAPKERNSSIVQLGRYCLYELKKNNLKDNRLFKLLIQTQWINSGWLQATLEWRIELNWKR